MKLILMTKSTFFVEEDKILSALFEEGLNNLHLYKPGSEPMYSERLLTLLPEDTRRLITVHEHFYLKNEFRLKGIHLDTPDMKLPAGYKGKYSRTCRDLSMLKTMKKECDYVLLRNVFDSQTDETEQATFTQTQLEEASERGLIDKHVYALGGMNIDTISRAKKLGFGGVVIRGDLWNRFNIHRQVDYKDIISHFTLLKNAVEKS